jgi:ZIP family zinc transporter
MPGSLVSVILYVLFPVGAMLLGASITAIRVPGPRLGSAIQHFAAGMVFAAVAIELLPDVVSKLAPVSTVIGFAAGVALMLTVREFSKRAERIGKGRATGSTGLLAAVGVDITIDGFLIGIGFAAGARQGLLLTVALLDLRRDAVVHNLRIRARSQ